MTIRDAIATAESDPTLDGDGFTQVTRQKRRYSGQTDEPLSNKRQQRPERTFTPPGPPTAPTAIKSNVTSLPDTSPTPPGLAQSMHAPKTANPTTRPYNTPTMKRTTTKAYQIPSQRQHAMDIDDTENPFNTLLTAHAGTDRDDDDDNMSQATAEEQETALPEPFQTPTAPPAHSGRHLLLQLLETEEAPPAPHMNLRTKTTANDQVAATEPTAAPPAPPFTPKPPGDFPTRHLSDPLALFKNMDKTQRKKWFGHAGPIAAIQVWGERANGNESTLQDLTTALLTALGKETPSFRISTPIRENSQAPCPPSYCLSQITPGDFYKLTDQTCWSFRSPRITFFITPFTWATPKFICALQGISAPHLPSLRTTIINTIIEEAGPAIQMIAEQNRPEGAIIPPDYAAQIANTVELALLPTSAPGGHNEPKVCLYINSPTDNMAQWVAFRDRIAGLTFDVGLDGEGTKWDYAPCSGCYGADHPRGLCPYRVIPGWNGKRGGRSTRQ